MTQITFRAMRTDDLHVVESIANQSFPTPWSVKTFKREIESNERGYYWVLALQTIPSEEENVIAHGGYWLLGDEAHIVTVATDPAWRRRGVGKLLVISMMQEAVQSGAETVSLEVRESNQIAIQLYTDLGFVEKGRRKEYYAKGKNSSDREDALILTCLDLQDNNSCPQLTQAHESALERVTADASFSGNPGTGNPCACNSRAGNPRTGGSIYSGAESSA